MGDAEGEIINLDGMLARRDPNGKVTQMDGPPISALITETMSELERLRAEISPAPAFWSRSEAIQQLEDLLAKLRSAPKVSAA